jgi:hypothetical protein
VSPVRYKLGFCIPEGGILHSHRRQNFKSYIALTGWALQRRRNMSPMRHELGFISRKVIFFIASAVKASALSDTSLFYVYNYIPRSREGYIVSFVITRMSNNRRGSDWQRDLSVSLTYTTRDYTLQTTTTHTHTQSRVLRYCPVHFRSSFCASFFRSFPATSYPSAQQLDHFNELSTEHSRLKLYQVKVKVILQPTVTRPVCLGISPPSRTNDQCLFLHEIFLDSCELAIVDALSDERTALYFTLAAVLIVLQAVSICSYAFRFSSRNPSYTMSRYS